MPITVHPILVECPTCGASSGHACIEVVTGLPRAAFHGTRIEAAGR